MTNKERVEARIAKAEQERDQAIAAIGPTERALVQARAQVKVLREALNEVITNGHREDCRLNTRRGDACRCSCPYSAAEDALAAKEPTT